MVRSSLCHSEGCRFESGRPRNVHICTDLYEFVLTVPSSAPRVLVYVFGECAKVPPSRPGFVIPEIAFGSIAVLALMMAALFLRGRVQIIPQ